MFWGAITALITPFKDGNIDETAFSSLVQWQVDSGIHALLPVATTGEAPTLTHAEHARLIKLTADQAKGSCPIIAGVGSASTATAIELAINAAKAGADAILFTPPPYNKPSQEGIFQHFKAIHDASSLPIIAYSNPGRTVVDFNLETLKRIAALKRVVGLKDASCSLFSPLQHRAELPKDFCLLSGDDNTMGAYLAQGGMGCISVIAKILPAKCVELQIAWRDKKSAAFQNILNFLYPLLEALGVDSNPIPVKYAASLLGKCSDEMRLPLTPLTNASKKRIEAAMQKMELI